MVKVWTSCIETAFDKLRLSKLGLHIKLILDFFVLEFSAVTAKFTVKVNVYRSLISFSGLKS